MKESLSRAVAAIVAVFFLAGCSTTQSPQTSYRFDPQGVLAESNGRSMPTCSAMPFDLLGVWDEDGCGTRLTLGLKGDRYSILSVVDRGDGEVFNVLSDIEVHGDHFTWSYS